MRVLIKSFAILCLALTLTTSAVNAQSTCSSIKFTNLYGQPGNFGLFIQQGSTNIYSTTFSVSPANGVYTVDLTPLNLTIGTTYTLVIYTYGYTGFGSPFSNYQVDLTPNLQFADGTMTNSGRFTNPTSLKLNFQEISKSSCGFQIVASIHSAKEEKVLVSSAITAHIPLGADFQMGLQDQDGNDLPATYALSNAAVLGAIDTPALFSNTVAFQYQGNGSATRGSFQSVHEGSVTLTLTPTSSQQSRPVTVNIIVEDPASLGSTYPEVDSLVYPIAHRTGIPPQFIKAQMAQEGQFKPKAFRYEPLSPWVGDYGAVSRNKDLRANSFSSYRFATFADSADDALAQGGLVDADDLDTVSGFLSCCGPTPKALDIVSSLDATQHWKNQGKRAKNNYKKLQKDDFTAQTSLASSYGYLQVMYATAITHLKWAGVSGFKNPTLLFDTPENLSSGGGSLKLGTTYLVWSFVQVNPSEAANPSLAYTDLNDLINDFFTPWAMYNNSKKYPPKVIVRIPDYLPVQARSIF